MTPVGPSQAGTSREAISASPAAPPAARREPSAPPAPTSRPRPRRSAPVQGGARWLNSGGRVVVPPAGVAVLRPFDKLPALNSAVLLLVGPDEALQQQLAEAILQEKKDFNISILKNVETSLAHVDASFFLGKVCFLVTGVGRMNACSIEMNAVCKLGEAYCSPVLFCELELEGIRVTTTQRLLQMLGICAGHLLGVSALSFVSLMRSSDDD